jgi:2-polyprenyl-3-methyl-5-hydroxy-6-metoxy-1,4-benzoquinol methylase
VENRTLDYLDRTHPLQGLHTRAALRMRARMFAALPLTPGMRVLEVGTTSDVELAESNYFCREARRRGHDVTVTSPEDCAAMADRYGLRWLPFGDLEAELERNGAFDLVVSSAVIEHVGPGDTPKREHLSLLRRASRRHVAITTPNRLHWLEFHTRVPLLHWLPKRTHRSCLRALGMHAWADPLHLDLLTVTQFRRLLREVFVADRIHVRAFWFLGLPSNFLAVVRRGGGAVDARRTGR